MSEEERFVDFATVREMLLNAQERAATTSPTNRRLLCNTQSGQQVTCAMDTRTLPEVFDSLRDALTATEKIILSPTTCSETC